MVIWQKKFQLLSFSLLIGVIISVINFAPNLKASFWIVDDHEIILFMDRMVKGSSWLESIRNTEAFGAGESLRFRPIYYGLRALEAKVWGYQPEVFYAFRLVGFGFFLGTVAWLLSNYFSAGWVLLLTFYLSTRNFWWDIVGRLGPSEMYVLWGFSFIMIAYKFRGWKSFALVLFGGLLCIGSKENLIVLPMILVPVSFLLEAPTRRLWWIAQPFLLAAGGFVFWAVSAAAKKAGSDVYGNKVDMVTRLGNLSEARYAILAPILAGIIWFLSRKYFPSKEPKVPLSKSTKFKEFLVVSVVLFFFYLSQVYFYNGSFPTEMRYDVPGMLAVVAMWFYVIWIALNYIQIKKRTALLLAAVILIDSRGIEKNWTKSTENVERTQRYRDSLSPLVEHLKQNPHHKVVMSSLNVFDIEPIASLEIYLDYFQVQNPLYLSLDGYKPEEVTSAREKILIPDLLKRSEGKYPGSRLRPLSEFKATSDCTVVSFEKPTPAYSQCKNFVIKF